MKRVLSPRKNISKLLWLVSIQWFVAGICVIILPDSLMNSLGFSNWFDSISHDQGEVVYIVLKFE